MNSEHWKQIKTIYQSAVETPHEKRAAFLIEKCGADAELRGEIEDLLRFERESANFIEEPAFDAASCLLTEDEVLLTEKQIGNYRIVREIGRGGMGTVFLAERTDGLFEKRVAIKILKRGMDTDAILKRFTMERQILAALDHPNIARLFDGGTTADGLPYFVMEFVEGTAVTDFCDRENLSINDRLKLFRKVCAAVAYAHRNLIIHRDLKPSNILVTADGTPKLLDFGIAKLLQTDAETGLTETEARLLTPEYASPEQIRGERVTTLSDVYSLGVLLYELLTGHRPHRFKTRAPQEIARVICSEEPERPSTAVSRIEGISNSDSLKTKRITPETVSTTREGTPERLRRKLRGDLDTILLTALRKEPERRYTSVEQFSEDVRRYLENLPVFARRDYFAYRMAKFVNRNRTPVFASVLMALALFGATFFSIWQARRANAERARAERRFNDVRKLANSVLYDYHDAVENLPGSTAVRQKMLSDSISYLNDLSQEAGSDRQLLSEIGAAYLKIGDVQGKPFAANTGDTKAAFESYRKAEGIFLSLLEREPENRDYKINLSRAFEGIGTIQMREMEKDAPIESHRKALEIREKLSNENPADEELRRLLADSLVNLSDALAVKSNLVDSGSRIVSESFDLAVESNRLLHSALEIRQDLTNRNPRDSARLFAHASCLVRSGFRASHFAYWRKKHNHALPNDARSEDDFQREAIGFHNRAIEITRQIQALEPENVKARRVLADTLMIVAEPLIEISETAAAQENLTAARVAFEEIAARDAANLEAKRDLVNVYDRLGRLFIARKNRDEAVKNFQKAIDLIRDVISTNPTQSDELQLVGLQNWLANAGKVNSRKKR
ncbi:MAG: protein kinase [Acidobacteriota bacterium]|nr:protein kinase [Acidobacteriota bacterium]